jgi:glycosyltransferase involved in cell wall biosynthesis
VKLSVVIPTFGRRDLLQRTLASLARQEGAPSFEAIVVEDGADPGMHEFVQTLAPPFAHSVVVHPRPRGRAATRNSGIARASGDAVIFLDGDMEVVPEFLAAHAEKHGALRSRSREDGDRAVVLGNIVTAPEIPRSAFVRYIDTRGVHKIAPGEEIPPRYFMTGNSSVAAALLERAGGFDEEFNEYGGEDTEMGYRLGAFGGKFVFAPGAVSYHLDLNSVPRMAERLRSYGERMLPILVRKVPAARAELHLDLAEPIGAEDGWSGFLGKAAALVVCRPLVWRPAAWLAGRLPSWMRADGLFDFVRACAYLDGYRQSLRGRRALS